MGEFGRHEAASQLPEDQNVPNPPPTSANDSLSLTRSRRVTMPSSPPFSQYAPPIGDVPHSQYAPPIGDVPHVPEVRHVMNAPHTTVDSPTGNDVHKRGAGYCKCVVM